jgi:hypothetical protein
MRWENLPEELFWKIYPEGSNYPRSDNGPSPFAGSPAGSLDLGEWHAKTLLAGVSLQGPLRQVDQGRDLVQGHQWILTLVQE